VKVNVGSGNVIKKRTLQTLNYCVCAEVEQFSCEEETIIDLYETAENTIGISKLSHKASTRMRANKLRIKMYGG
jgi:hypothetical protein